MSATAARPRRGGLPTAPVVGLVIGGVIGLFLGFAWRASEGADCGPIGGLDELLMRGLIGLVAVVMLVIAGLVAFLRRRGAASGSFAALGGFAIAVLIGHSLGMPLNTCGYAVPEPQTEPATLTLQLGAPLDLNVTGPGLCQRDADTGKVSVEAVIDGEPAAWTADPYQVVDISYGYGFSSPGLQVGLVRGERTNIVFRQTEHRQVVERVAANGRSGTTEFDLPLLDDSDVTEPAQILGTLEWTCD